MPRRMIRSNQTRDPKRLPPEASEASPQPATEPEGLDDPYDLQDADPDLKERSWRAPPEVFSMLQIIYGQPEPMTDIEFEAYLARCGLDKLWR